MLQLNANTFIRSQRSVSDPLLRHCDKLFAVIRIIYFPKMREVRGGSRGLEHEKSQADGWGEGGLFSGHERMVEIAFKNYSLLHHRLCDHWRVFKERITAYTQ